MAKTSGPRIGLTRWSAGTDSVARADFDGDNADLDAKAMLFAQGTLAARPAAGVSGRIYTVTGDETAENNRKMFYDTGSTWLVGGSYGTDVLNEASTAGVTALSVRGASGQTADIFQVKNNSGTNLFKVTMDGIVTNQVTPGSSPGAYFGLTSSHASAGYFRSIGTGKQVLLARGMAGQTEAIIAAQNDSGSNLFRVLPNGDTVISGDVQAATANVTGTLTVGSITTSSGTVTLKNVITTPNAINDSPLTTRGLASQTGNLINAQDNSSVNRLRVSPDGSLSTSGKIKIGNGAGTDTGNYASNIPSLVVHGQGLDAATPSIRLIGGSGSTGNLFEIQNSVASVKYWFNNTGNSGQSGNAASVSGYFGSTNGVPSQIYNTTYTPRLEVLTGSDTEAFDDLVVLRHSTTSTNPVTRRVGVAFKMGDESSTANSNLSASIGVRSDLASSADPHMYVRVAGQDSARVTSTGNLEARSRFNLWDATTGDKIRLYNNSESFGMGVQSDTLYFRSTGAFNWYKGGTFEAGGAAVPGSGGTQLMNLDTGGRVTATRVNITSGSYGASDAALRVANLSGTHLNVGGNTLDSYANSAQTTGVRMYLQAFTENGEIQLGAADTKVLIPSRTLWVSSNRVYFGGGTWAAQGGAPIPNDWWFDHDNNQIKVRNGETPNIWKVVADDATFS